MAQARLPLDSSRVRTHALPDGRFESHCFKPLGQNFSTRTSNRQELPPALWEVSVYCLILFHYKYRSHFGSRYTLGCCACAGLFLLAPFPFSDQAAMAQAPPRLDSSRVRTRALPEGRFESHHFKPLGQNFSTRISNRQELPTQRTGKC